MSTANIHPPSPAESPRIAALSPPISSRNLKVESGTQHVHHNSLFPLSLLDTWDERYNRHSIPLMGRIDFERLIASVVQDLSTSAALEDVEATIAERMRHDTIQVENQLEKMKREVFLNVNISDGIEDLLPFIRRETLLGWLRYIIKTLSMLTTIHSTQRIETTQKQVPNVSNEHRKAPLISRQQARATSNTLKRQATRVHKIRKDGVKPVRRSDRIRNIAEKRVV